MKLLAIETSGPASSVALLEDQSLIMELALDPEQRTSVTLLPGIIKLLEEQSLQPQQLDALAVSAGPGSYTGVRVGIATAQGIAAAANLPVYGASSLQGLALQASTETGAVAVLRRARAGEVLFCVYQSRDTLTIELIPEGRYANEEVRKKLKELKGPVSVLVEAGVDEMNWADLPHCQAEPITAKASAIGRIAQGLPPSQAHPRGEGLKARNYGPGYRI
jgi:tRNA threonylcarbamoyladenosine biosynthesis protein TsaB